MGVKELYNDAVSLLCDLIRIPSPSREENDTANLLANWLADKKIENVERLGNNLWVRNLHFLPEKPTILLCSHHDTVKPTSEWTRNPFEPTIERGGEVAEGRGTTVETGFEVTEGCGEAGHEEAKGHETTIGNGLGGVRLYGLGSNDAGASVVAMAAAFRYFYKHKGLTHNIILALVGEEEISGPGGVRAILPKLALGKMAGGFRGNAGDLRGNAGEDSDNFGGTSCDFAIVGEPTGMQMAVAEKGLMVLDCVAKGRTGHAAREEGDNAIYHAIRDIEWFKEFRFPRKSPLFGEVKMSVTMVAAGTQHNVVPAECKFTVDCRVTEQYTNEEVLETVRQHVRSEVTPRSVHLRSSSISLEHPIVVAGKSLGLSTFGSPTTSDQVAMTEIPSVKIGPGQSARSHTADEYVELVEIEEGILLYIKLLEKIL